MTGEMMTSEALHMTRRKESGTLTRSASEGETKKPSEFRPSLARRVSVGTRRRGATVLEMAIVSPLVLTLLIGTVDLGIAVYRYNTIAEAARAGTRYAAVHGSSATKQVGPSANNSDVETVVRSRAPGFIASDLTVTSSWPDGDNNSGDHVTVSVNYTYRPAMIWVLSKTVKLGCTSTITISH